MLSKSEAQALLAKVYPTATIKTWAPYRNFYLFQVEHPSTFEKNWDPFFSVDNNTGEVRDFSVITDGNLSEINKLNWQGV